MKSTTQDIVGYSTATLASGESKAFAVHFDDITTPGKAVCVTNVFTAFEGTLKGNAKWGLSMDQIWFWNKTANAWNLYGFYKPKVAGSVGGWKKYDALNNTFGDIDSATDVLVQGDSFLYVHNEAGNLTMTLSGAVKPFTGSNAYQLASGESQYIAYPWPVAIKINDFVKDKYIDLALKGNAKWGLSMDQIWLWNTAANAWTLYGFYKPKVQGAVGAWNLYDSLENTFKEATDADVIPADAGVLYVHNEAGTLNINFEWAAK